MMSNVRAQRARSIAGWLWNRVREVATFVPLALIVLKLTGVITWSWWWVLSPFWLSGIAVAVLIGGLFIGTLIALRRDAHRQARSWMNSPGPQWFRDFLSGELAADTTSGHPGPTDGSGQGAGPPGG